MTINEKEELLLKAYREASEIEQHFMENYCILRLKEEGKLDEEPQWIRNRLQAVRSKAESV